MTPRPKRTPREPARLSPAELDRVVHFRLADVMQGELSRKLSEPDALRKALLTLIVLAADGADEPARQYVDYLLTHFTPLAGKFDGHAQPLWRGHPVARARAAGGTHLRLAASDGLVAELLKDVPGVGAGPGRRAG